MFWTPTVEGLYNYEYLKDNPEALDDPSWHLDLPDSIIADIKKFNPISGRFYLISSWIHLEANFGTKNKSDQNAGAVLLIGTDSGIPMKFHSQSTWNELDVWVNKFGFDPMYTIRAATYWPSVANESR